MVRKTVSMLYLVLLLLLSSCNLSLPDEMPDVGINDDEIEFNVDLQLTAPKQLNSYKSGDSVSLEIENRTTNEWNFNINKDILIYKYVNKEWKRVSDKMINIGATELTLGPRESFPYDKHIVSVLPEVDLDQSTCLRIIIIVHGQTSGKESLSKGAYVDVLLRP